MTEPTYTDDELAAAEAELPPIDPADTERVAPGDDTEADEVDDGEDVADDIPDDIEGDGA